MKLISLENHTQLNCIYSRINKKIETVLEFLIRRFRYYDVEEWRRAIQIGRLWVDDQQATEDQILQNQQQLAYFRPDFLEPEVDRSFEVVYEDDFLIAINKSGDIPTSPSGRYFKNTLVHVVKAHFGWEKLYTLHRLDRETSGVILFAKQQEIAQHIAQQFQNRLIRKTYSGILQKPLPTPHVILSIPIGVHHNSVIRIKQGFCPTGKWSETHFKFQEEVHGFSKVSITPLTGRTHQIRVHAAYLGSPLVGDKLYGLSDQAFLDWLNRGENDVTNPFFAHQRQLLHASELICLHPVTQKELVLQAKDRLSEELLETLEKTAT